MCLGRRVPIGKLQKTLPQKDLRGKTLAFKKCIAITSEMSECFHLRAFESSEIHTFLVFLQMNMIQARNARPQKDNFAQS